MKIKQGPIRYDIESIDVCISEKWTNTFRKYSRGNVYGKSKISIVVNGILVKKSESGDREVRLVDDCSMLKIPSESAEITNIENRNPFAIEITVNSVDSEFVFDKVADILRTELPQYVEPNDNVAYG
ncbi:MULTISPECIES: hypothetical protein [Halorubrum]|uniref:Uncharacterized protein n=1 Tax=Halorubrum ruber TaxID=2982524 RepID=A0A8T8LNR4_9EURY|nr:MULTISPECIES: hypothetical protein [Halorubrum]QUO48779.1 hypothetical protein J7656_05375 [Halorubrum ruber]